MFVVEQQGMCNNDRSPVLKVPDIDEINPRAPVA